MLDWLPGGVADWSSGTLLLIVVLMILTDRLVTKGRLEEAKEQAKLWQENAMKQQAINQQHAETAKENAKAYGAYAEAALLQEKVMHAVQERHKLGNGGGTDETAVVAE